MMDILMDDFESEYMKDMASADDLVFMGGRKTISLNGTWNYAIDQYNTCLRQKWFKEYYKDADGRTLPVDFSFDEWPTVELPCNMNLVEKEFFWYEGPFVFTRKFKWEKEEDEKVLLRIGAANYKARVFVNGEYAGMHLGGNTPFVLDITALLKEDNRVIIVCDNTRHHWQVPTENTDWFNYSGIYRDIEIIRLPKSYIKDLRINLVPGSEFGKIEVSVETEGPGEYVNIQIPELDINEDIVISNNKGKCIFEKTPSLWTTKTPKLYDVAATFINDTVSDRVGFREIKVVGRDILLNGEPLFLHGISMHEDIESHGKALTDEDRLESVRIAGELGANFIRAAHYPHHENLAKLCDEIGMMLWEEIPVYWAIEFENKETYKDAENQLKELIKRDYNRASVIIWSVGNENADSDPRFRFMGSLADFAHDYDKTRPVSAACLVDGETNSIKDRLADKLDIIGQNEYLGWYSPNFDDLPKLFENSNPSKPVIITECGADAMPGYHGTIEEKGTEECQAYVYEKQIEVIKTIPYIKGMSPWILFDFRCPRRTSSIQLYYNRKGLCTSDRAYKKPAFEVLRKFYEEFEK